MVELSRSVVVSVLGLGLALGGFVGCFIEAAQPSTFRFQCASDGECEDGQVCAEGLCQQPCGGEDDDPCANEAPICLNGYCASLCPLPAEGSDDVDVCPQPQSCVELPESFSGFGFDTGSSGACLVACADDSGCVEGEVCDTESGLCFPDLGSTTGGETDGETGDGGDGTCTTADDCGAGQDCVMGYCATTCTMADECDVGQDCVMGYCVATCTTADDCNPGEQCLGGFCIPG